MLFTPKYLIFFIFSKYLGGPCPRVPWERRHCCP